MAVRVDHPQPLATPSAAVAAGHIGCCSGLVDEHQPLEIEVELPVEPCLALAQLALAQNVGAVLLDRVPNLFTGDPVPDKEAMRVEITTATPA